MKYHREIYEKRYEIESQFRRMKGFRRISSYIEKLDALFLEFILFVFALIFNILVLPHGRALLHEYWQHMKCPNTL